MTARWIAVTENSNPDEMEAFGPFTSSALAHRFVAEYEKQGCRPAYPLVVIELFPVREGLRQVREEKRINEWDDRRV